MDTDENWDVDAVGYLTESTREERRGLLEALGITATRKHTTSLESPRNLGVEDVRFNNVHLHAMCVNMLTRIISD